MMAAAATPARPLPGGFAATPGATPGPGGAIRPPAFRVPSNPRAVIGGSAGISQPPTQPSGPLSDPPPQTTLSATSQNPVEVAAKTINNALAGEARYPDLESLIASTLTSFLAFHLF